MDAGTNTYNPLTADYMTEDEAAEIRGQGRRTLRGERQRREGPPWLKIGNRVFYSRAGMKTWLASIEVHPSKLKARRPA